MAKKPLVHCRRCKLEIDRDNQNDWCMPSKGWYYHKSCYEDFVKKKGKITEGDIEVDVDDDLWQSAVYDYLRQDLKIAVNWNKFSSQWKNFLTKNMTAKGIYFSLRYFYEIAKGDPKKSENGIGIVSHIYNEATQYWGERNQRDKGICARIEAQIKQMQEEEARTVVIHRKRKAKPNRQEIDLSIIADMEDEE